MKELFSIILFSIILLFPGFLSAQINYETYATFGFSNLNETNWEESYIIGNSYSYAPAYSLSFLGVKSFSAPFKIKAGLEIESIATKVGLKDNFMELDELDIKKFLGIKRYYTIGAPISLSYAYEKYLYFNIGIDNKLLLNKPKLTGTKIYTLGFLGGFDLVINKNYMLGLTYKHDITPFRKIINKEIYYYSDQYNIKFSYIFD